MKRQWSGFLPIIVFVSSLSACSLVKPTTAPSSPSMVDKRIPVQTHPQMLMDKPTDISSAKQSPGDMSSAQQTAKTTIAGSETTAVDTLAAADAADQVTGGLRPDASTTLADEEKQGRLLIRMIPKAKAQVKDVTTPAQFAAEKARLAALASHEAKRFGDSGQKTASGKLVVGQEEWVYVAGLDALLKAELTQQVDTALLNVSDMQEFTRNNQAWVTFKVRTNQGKSTQSMSLPVIQWVKVSPYESTTYSIQSPLLPMVKTWIRLGSLQEPILVRLTQLANQPYQLLLGRRFLGDVAEIDPKASFVQGKPQIH